MKIPVIQTAHKQALKLSLLVAIFVSLLHEAGHYIQNDTAALLVNIVVVFILLFTIHRYLNRLQHGESSLHNELLIQALKNRILFEDAPVAMLEIHDNQIVVSNLSARELLGRSPENENFYDFLHPSDHQLVRDWLENPACHSALEQRVNLISQQHKSATVELSMIEQSDWQSSILLVLYDVSEQATQEALLKQSQQRLELALMGSRDATWDWDLASGTIYFSSRGWQMLGMQQDEIPSTTRTWKQRIHPDDLAQLQAQVSHALKGNDERYEVNFRMLHKEGYYLPLLARGFILRDNTGKAIRVCGTNSDRSSQASFEQSLLEDVRQMGAFIANLPGYVYRSRYLTPCTPDFISTGVESITGHAQDDYLLHQSTLHGQEIHDEDRHRVMETIRHALLRQNAYEVEYRIQAKSGALKWVWERGRGILSKDGLLQGREGFVTEITDRKTAEQALAESEYRWKFALEGAGDGVWDWDLASDRLYVSPRWKQMLGYDPETAITSPLEWDKKLHADEANLVRMLLGNHLAGLSDSYTSEHRLLCRDGSWKWVLDRGLVVERDTDGKARRIIGSTTDITERKKILQTLQQRESLLSRMGQIAKIGGWELDLQKNQLSWSDQTYRIHELSPQTEIDLQGAIDFVEADFRNQLSGVISMALQNGQAWDLELPIITASGRQSWIRMQGEALYEGEHILKLHGAYQDISEHKQIKQALHKEKTRLNAIFDSVVDSIIVINAEQNIEELNPAACDTFGYQRQQAKLLNIRQLISQDHQSVFDALLDKAGTQPLHLGERKGSELLMQKRSGDSFPAEITLADWQENDETFFTVAIRDITARKAVQAQLIQSQKMESLSLLSGGLAHDFNNLLGIITGNLDFLEPRLEGDEKALQRLQSAIRATERGADITRRMLALSKQRSSNRSTQAYQINTLINEILKILQRMLGPNFSLITDLAPDAHPCQLDPAEFENVLLNLTVNARDAMPDGGEIHISTRNLAAGELLAPTRRALDPGRQYLEITFSDNGCGMSEDVKQRAFEPFFSTKEAKGTGLGLAMVYTFIKDLGGQVRVESTPAIGSTFYLYLPSSEQVSAIPAANPRKEALPKACAGETVLVVDDEADLLSTTTDHLQQLGYQTLSAANASAALNILAEQPGIHLLLSDVVMPGGMFGTELALRVQEHYPDIAILLCSGFPQKIKDDPEYQTLAAHLINKPFRKSELAIRVRERLDEQARNKQPS